MKSRLISLVLIWAFMLIALPVQAMQKMTMDAVVLNNSQAHLTQPKFGKFLARDPIGYAGGSNLYSYCGGDPVNHSDPSGLNEELRAMLAGLGTVVSSGTFTILTTGAPIAGQATLATGSAGLTAAFVSITEAGPVAAPLAVGGGIYLYTAMYAPALHSQLFPHSIPGLVSNECAWQSTQITEAQARRIQNAANSKRITITVYGSRVKGTATATSDFDYILSGPSRQRSRVQNSLPKGDGGGGLLGSGRESGADFWQDYNPNAPGYRQLPAEEPRVIFRPR